MVVWFFPGCCPWCGGVLPSDGSGHKCAKEKLSGHGGLPDVHSTGNWYTCSWQREGEDDGPGKVKELPQ